MLIYIDMFALLAPDSYVDIMEYFSFGYKKFLQLKPNKEIHRILLFGRFQNTRTRINTRFPYYVFIIQRIFR